MLFDADAKMLVFKFVILTVGFFKVVAILAALLDKLEMDEFVALLPAASDEAFSKKATRLCKTYDLSRIIRSNDLRLIL